ncbi:MAG: radical SAM protein, partial [Promethearchaeota archaeon]
MTWKSTLIQQTAREIQQLRNQNPQFLYLGQIHLTHRCNILPEAQCRNYCYNWDTLSQDMPFSEFDRILRTHTPRQIALGGGEPTLHPEFLRFVTHAKKTIQIKHVNYTTNAVAIPPNFTQLQELISGVS